MSLEYKREDEPEFEDQAPETSAQIQDTAPYYTILFVAAIAAVFLVQIGTDLESSILAAGFVKPAFSAGGEYWRILTGAATHGSILHVVMNSYAFYSFGRIFEMLSNRAHLALVFVLSAIGGGVLSLLFNPDGISVGASGGIVGVIGYLAVYAFRRRQFISPEFRKSLLINIGFIILFGLALYQVIDNYGHIGGLLTGIVYGLLQIPSDEYVDPRKTNSVTSLLGLAALGIYIAACGFSILLILQIV